MKIINFYLDNFHTFGQILLNKMKTTLSIFIKLKLIFSRMIILIMFEKILKIGWHLHSLKADFEKRTRDKKNIQFRNHQGMIIIVIFGEFDCRSKEKKKHRVIADRCNLNYFWSMVPSPVYTVTEVTISHQGIAVT